MRLSDVLLLPPVSKGLSERYMNYRRHSAPPFSALLGCLLVALGWIFLPLENARWQSILSRRGFYWPQIDSNRPRPLDLARYALQTLWLLVVRPAPVARPRTEPSASRLSLWGQRYHEWLLSLPGRIENSPRVNTAR